MSRNTHTGGETQGRGWQIGGSPLSLPSFWHCTKPRPSSWYPLAQENVTSAFIGMAASLANTLPLLVVTMVVPCSGSDTGVHVTSGEN